MKRTWIGTAAFAAPAIGGAAGQNRPGAQTPPQSPLERVQGAIVRTTRRMNDTWGVFVKSLDSGKEIAADADRLMETMSPIKIPRQALKPKVH